MVKELEGNGWNYVRFANENGINITDYRVARFENGHDRDQREKQFLRELRSLPEFDEQSILLCNVSSLASPKLNVLLLPRACPSIVPDETPQTGEMPKEGETWVATFWDQQRPFMKKNFLILAGEPDVEKIARARSREILSRQGTRDIGLALVAVSPDKFIDEAKKIIDQGVRLPKFILRFDGLAQYAKEYARSA